MTDEDRSARKGAKKNVMLLIPSMRVGGSERSVSNISKLLDGRYNVYVTVFSGKNAAVDAGGRLIDLNQPARDKWRKPFVALRRVIALRRAARKHRIDAIFGFTSVGCRYIVFAPKTIKRVLCNRGFEETVTQEAFYTRLLRRCDALLFNSNASRHWFAKRNAKLAEKVCALQNCFDIGAIEAKCRETPDETFLRFCEGRAVIVSMGRLCDVKGFDFLIKAFLLLLQDIPGAGLAIIGDGPSMPRLKKLAKSGGGSVLFTGMRNNPFPYVAASRLYVLPSRAEGFPNALVEAMACGIPVIAANCDTGPNEILNDSYDPNLRVAECVKARYGMLVPPVTMPADDQAELLESAHFHLARAMKTMLTDKALYEGYQIAARKRAGHFSFENSLERYAAFLEGL